MELKKLRKGTKTRWGLEKKECNENWGKMRDDEIERSGGEFVNIKR
jgi:hypothetical protein